MTPNEDLKKSENFNRLMKNSSDSPTHYFSSKPHTPQKLRKMFESIRTHTLSLQTSTGIFSPDSIDKGTRILIENMVLHPISEKPLKILDLGAGYGPMVIWIHKNYEMEYSMKKLGEGTFIKPQIFASEINERAVWLLKRNLLQNDCSDVRILKGDFRDRFPELKLEGVKFDAIYTNPPLKAGHKVMLELFKNSMELLDQKGLIQYIHKKSLGSQAFLDKLTQINPTWQYKTIKKTGGYHVIVLSPSEFEFTQETSQKGYF